MPDNSSNNRRIAKNTLALFFRTALVTLVSLYLARALLDVLGKEDYGIYNLVGSIVVTFSFLNSTLQSAFQRFMNFALGKNDTAQFRKIFSMSFLILAILVLIVILLSETVGLWFLNNKLNIPPDRMFAARWAFQFTVLTFSIGVMRIPLESSVVAHEKMTFFAYLSILEQALRLVVVFCLYRSPIDKLIFYASLLSCTSVITYFVYVLYCRRKFEYCRLQKVWDKDLFKNLFSFSGWTFMGSTTALGTQQAFIFLLNIFYGVVANAAMGIANSVSNAINSLIAGFQTAFKPQIVKSFAQDDISYVHKMIHTTSKISFILMFIPGILVIVNAPFILDVWLKEVPEYTVSFCRMMLVCLIIDATTGPYYAGIMASGNIKWYQVCISIVFCLDIALMCVLFKLGVGAEYILYSRIATRGVMNMFVGLHFLKRQLNFDLAEYFKRVILRIAAVVIITVPILLVLERFFDGWRLLAVSCLFVCSAGLALSYYIILGRTEREIISNTFLKRFKH